MLGYVRFFVVQKFSTVFLRCILLPLQMLSTGDAMSIVKR